MGPTTTRPDPTAGDQRIELLGVDWAGYIAMLKVRGDRSSPRMIYLDGRLMLVSPSYLHERLKQRLGTFVTEVAVGLRIRHIPAGQTTFRRRRRRGGVEGDQTYYFANAERVRGKDRIDLGVDPPPDLAIEVVHTHGASEAVAAYRRLRVPEVWVWDDAIRILVLQANGRYAESNASAALPFLTASEISSWLGRPDEGDETAWAEAVRRWVVGVLAPRLIEG